MPFSLTQEELKANPQFMELWEAQQDSKSAMTGELGVFRNPRGGISTEISITENIPELGGWVNIPLLVQGQPPDAVEKILAGDITREHRIAAIRRAFERVKAGQELPVFKTLEEAETFAQQRSKGKL